MPIVYVSGLTADESEKKKAFRRLIKESISRTMQVNENHVTVVSIYDDTIDENEHVMIALVSKLFNNMEQGQRDNVCREVGVSVQERLGKHPFHEVFVLDNSAMCGGPFQMFI